MSLQITRVATPSGMYAYKCPYAMTPSSLTIHETDNFATAMSEVSYMLSNYNQTSYHFAVDDERAVQGLPLDRNGWHAGDGGSGAGNRRSIGIEICMNYRNGQSTLNDLTYNPRYLKARTNAIELAARLHIQFGWGTPRKNVTLFRHHDRDGKWCPRRILNENYWDTFCNLVSAKYNELTGKTGGSTQPAKPNTNQTTNKKGVATMYAIYWKKVGNANQAWFFNGVTVEHIHHPDSIKALKEIYKKNNGTDLPEIWWTDPKAPWWMRAEQPVVNLQAMSDKIDKLEKTIDAINKKVK